MNKDEQIAYDLLKKELELLRAEERDRHLNPHLYFDLYDWQDEFIYQRAHMATYGVYPHRLYLTCANQVGKTFALMGLAHMLCTNKEFRENRWGENQPKVIWYVLPTQEHINDFYNEKWEPDVLSRDEAKESGPYSWKVVKKGSDIKGIFFKETKCTLTFITISAKSSSHQGRSVGAILFDEEPPVKKLAELETRTASFNDPETGESNAIIAFAFTPTSAQDYFKRAFQFQDERFLKHIPRDIKNKYFKDDRSGKWRTCSEQEEKNELFPAGKHVWKRRVSMFEAQTFKSGKRGKFTEARIRQYIKDQPSKRDVLVRAFAQFEKETSGGRIYDYFNRDKHIRTVKKSYIENFYNKGILTAGMDYGSGSNHPGGIVITWISDDRKKVRVLKMWRGEPNKVTTAGDIVEKYLEMTRGLEIHFPFYDQSCADLKTIYNRLTGKSLIPAQKSHEIGVGLVDALLKHNILGFFAHEDEPYGEWLANEYENLDHGTNKKDRLDELTDCVRYSLAGVAHMFDLEEMKDKEVEEIQEDEEVRVKTPEDYGVRSWSNVPEDKKEDEWITDELGDWEDYFNG